MPRMNRQRTDQHIGRAVSPPRLNWAPSVIHEQAVGADSFQNGYLSAVTQTSSAKWLLCIQALCCLLGHADVDTRGWATSPHVLMPHACESVEDWLAVRPRFIGALGIHRRPPPEGHLCGKGAPMRRCIG